MNDENVDAPLKISRTDLYELVWSKPMRDLAKDFGVSDVALAKRCRRLGIPVPGRGYWARVDAGQAPHRPALPERQSQWRDHRLLTLAAPAESTSQATSEVPAPGDVAATNWDGIDAAWLKERLTEEARPDSAVKIPSRTQRWHPAIAALREPLEQAAETLRESKAAWERYQKLPDWRKRSFSDEKCWAWSYVRNNGQRIADTVRAMPFRVSLGTYQRALRLANALALALSDRGFTVEEDATAGRIVATVNDARVELRITELLKEATRPRVRYDGETEQDRYKEPTGRLRLTLSTGCSEGSSFEDGPSTRLEDQLGRAICAIYRRIVKVRRADRELKAYWARAEAERRRQAEEARILAQQEAARAAELARRRRLAAEAGRWFRAQRIRDYVAHLQSCAPPRRSSSEGFVDWSAWALRVAEEMDPTQRRVADGEPGDGLAW